MRLTDPVLTLTFLGNDIQPGHSAEQTIDYEDIIQGSIHKRPQLLNGLKSSGSVCEIAISRDCLSTEDIIATDGDIEAVLSDNGSPIFTGYLSTKYSWIVGNHGEEALALTIEDVGTRRLTGNFIESGYHLFNTSAKNAVKAVCDACGITISESAIDIPQQIFRVVDSTMTNKQIIDEILYACNHVYYFDNLGEMNFFEVNVVSVTGRTIGSSDLVVRNGRAIQLTKDVRTYRSARVTYHPLGEAENYLIYRNTTGQDSSHPYCYIELKPGEHFDGAEIYSAAEWAEAIADEFRLPTLIEAVNADSETALVGSNKIVSVSNVRIVADKDSAITASIVGVGGPYIKIDCQNTSAHVAYIRRLDAVASIVFENGTSIVNAGVSDGSTQTRLEETTECLHDRESVTKHANLLSQFNAYCNSKYTFSTTQLISLGEIVTIEDTTYTGLSVAVMVIAYADSDKHNVIDYTAIGVAVFDLDKEAYHQNTDIGKSETKGRSSQWITGTVLEGDSFARGVAGLVGDMYLNTDTYNLYRCVQSGDSFSAMWQYVGNIKGADATSEGLTYEIQYGLSDSDEEFSFPDATIGYTEGTFGAIDPEDDEQFEYGFKNYDWSPSTEGWYKGLYVWTRVKITDSEGNTTYSDPTYSKDITDSLVQSCRIGLATNPKTFVYNPRKRDYQYIPLSCFVIGYKGTLTLTTYLGIFAQQVSGEWVDKTNTITFSATNPTAISGYAIKLPYTENSDAIIVATLVDWTGDSITEQTVISPSAAKTLALQMETVDTYADLPTSSTVADSEANVNIGDNITVGDYALVKYVTLTPSSGVYRDDNGNEESYDPQRTYYVWNPVSEEFEIISIAGFDGTTTYYRFAVYPYAWNGLSWVRTSSKSIKATTVEEVVSLAKSQKEIDTSLDYHETLYAYEAYITNLSVGLVNAGDIFANDIKSNNYEEDANGNPVAGYSLEYQGGENRDGMIKSVGGIYKDINVRDTLRLWQDDTETVGADIEHPALTTISEVMSEDPTGVTINTVASRWLSDALLSAVSSITKNVVGTASGTFGSRTLRRYVFGNNLNAVLQASISQNLTAPGTGAISTITISVPSYITANIPITITGNANRLSKYYADSYIPDYRYDRGNAIVTKNGNSSSLLASSSYFDYQFSYSTTLTGGDTLSVSCGAASMPGGTLATYDSAKIQYTLRDILLSDYIPDIGFWLEYTDGSMEIVDSGISISERLQMSAPMSYDSNSHLTLRDCSAFIDYRTFIDADNTQRTLQNGRTYAIKSTNLQINGTSVVGKDLTRLANSIVLYFTYNNTRYSLTMESGTYYNVLGKIQIDSTSTIGVKMMGNYPKRDADDPSGGFDCGNSVYVWDHGYFKTVNYSNLNQGSAKKLKENIETFDKKALDILKATEIVYYNYKKDKNKSLKIGFIADDTPEELAGKDHDKMELDHCVSVLIKAVQELAAEIESLKKEQNNG